MSLAAALGALEPTVLGPQCSVCKLLGVLSGEDRQAVLDVLSNELVSGRAIEAALRREGLRVGAGSANRHRRGDCRAGTAQGAVPALLCCLLTGKRLLFGD